MPTRTSQIPALRLLRYSVPQTLHSRLPGNLHRRTMATPSLPALPETQRLSPRVIRILGGNPSKFTLQGTNTYLVGTGSSRILIDTAEGKPSWRSALSALLTSENATIDTALITHWHGDHVGGVSDLFALNPKTTIRKFSPGYKGSSEWKEITDGEVFTTDGASLRAVHCPGHTEDHVAFVLSEEDDAVFAGDNVLGHGTAVFEDLGAYMRSLDKLGAQCGAQARVYPGHGEVVESGRGKIHEYMEHRRMRERQVLSVLEGEAPSLENGAWTPGELVKVIYKDVPQNLHLPAEGGVRQVLAKLVGDGKVATSGEDGWRVVRSDGGKAGL